MDIYRVTIKRIKHYDSRVKVYYFDKPENFDWAEGSHVHLGLPGFNIGERPNKELVRHMSILTLSEENEVGVITRLDSSASLYKQSLGKMQSGDEAYLFKSSSIMHLRRDGRPVVVAAMGVAIGALRPLVLSYSKNPQGVPYMHAITVNRAERYPFQEEIEALRADQLTVVHAKSRAQLQSSLRGLSTEQKPWFLLIGSDDFLLESIHTLQDLGIELKDIIVDLKAEKREALFKRLGLSLLTSQV